MSKYIENIGKGRANSKTWNKVLQTKEHNKNIGLGSKTLQYLYLVFKPTKTWKWRSIFESRGGLIGTTIVSRTWFAAGWLKRGMDKSEKIDARRLTRPDIPLWIGLQRKQSRFEWLFLKVKSPYRANAESDVKAYDWMFSSSRQCVPKNQIEKSDANNRSRRETDGEIISTLLHSTHGLDFCVGLENEERHRHETLFPRWHTGISAPESDGIDLLPISLVFFAASSRFCNSRSNA